MSGETASLINNLRDSMFPNKTGNFSPRKRRICILVLIALFLGLPVLLLANYYISLVKEDVAAQATIAAGVITLYGLIFSALYNEISTYYKERTTNQTKKWELIFPFIKEYYYPWINSANSLASSLRTITAQSMNDEKVNRVLYLTLVFYGYRLKFIEKAGGLILLRSDKDEKKVMNAYAKIKQDYQWASDETPRRVSYLQSIFLKRDKCDNPFVLSTFTDEIQKDATLQESRKIMRTWLTEERAKKAAENLESFANTFKTSIDILYTDWGD